MEKVFLIIALVLLGSYAAFMGVYYATSFPVSCGLCHEVKPYYLSWQSSLHRGVNCGLCHEGRGFLGKLQSKTRGLNSIYQQMTGQYTIIAQGRVFDQNCIACHLGDYRSYPKVKKIDENHYRLIKQDKSCLECHRMIGHKVNLFSRQKFKK